MAEHAAATLKTTIRRVYHTGRFTPKEPHTKASLEEYHPNITPDHYRAIDATIGHA